jgi:hypothetical protein
MVGQCWYRLPTAMTQRNKHVTMECVVVRCCVERLRKRPDRLNGKWAHLRQRARCGATALDVRVVELFYQVRNVLRRAGNQLGFLGLCHSRSAWDEKQEDCRDGAR